MKWWAYLHKNKSIQVKRYFSEEDIAEAYESPFVIKVFPVIETDTRVEAYDYYEKKYINKEINNEDSKPRNIQ